MRVARTSFATVSLLDSRSGGARLSDRMGGGGDNDHELEEVDHVTRDEYIAQLQAAGHFHGAVIRQVNGRFRYECECGYRSTTRTSMREAIDTAEHHRRKALAEFNRNGVSVRPSVGAGL